MLWSRVDTVHARRREKIVGQGLRPGFTELPGFGQGQGHREAPLLEPPSLLHVAARSPCLPSVEPGLVWGRAPVLKSRRLEF